MTPPVIGLTAWRRRLNTAIGAPETLHAVADPYIEAVTEAGARPLVVPGALDPHEAGFYLDLVDGLVLTGGGDVDPGAYGAHTLSSHDNDPIADAWELAMIAAARVRDIPLLAICRGIQILNVSCGGTLRQEVTSADTVHLPLQAGPEELMARRHPVHLSPGGVLENWYGAGAIDVNSLHHQGIDVLGDGLAVEAEADDGLIEAVRSTSSWWALGVQWHPERLPEHRRTLFGHFAQLVAARPRQPSTV